MKTEPNETSLRKAKAKLDAQLDRIEKQKRIAKNAAFLGRCFKYRNTYGTGANWWLYGKVIKAAENLQLFQFEITSHQHFDARNRFFVPHLIGWTEITQKEYRAAWNKFQKQLTAAANQ